MDSDFRKVLLYAAKCVTGAALVYAVARPFHYTDIGWCLISVVLVLSPNDSEAMQSALARVKGNLIASVVSILCLLLGPTNLLILCLGFTSVLLLCHVLKAMEGSRPALAAVAIILLHDRVGTFWAISLQRTAAVVAGCLLGLLITYVFHWALGEGRPSIAPVQGSE